MLILLIIIMLKIVNICFQINNVLNHGQNEKKGLDQKIQNLLKEMQLLESAILTKSETINSVTTSMDSYHNEILNKINEVLNDNFHMSCLI